MSRGKHSLKSDNETKKIIKRILVIVFIIILFLVLFQQIIGYKERLKNKIQENVTTVEETLLKIDTSNVNIESDQNIKSQTCKTKKVENSDYLEILDFDIKSQKEFSYVRFKIKNNSNNAQKDINLLISVLNEDEETIAEFTSAIKNINPGETIESVGLISKDVSNAYNYNVKIV